MKPSDALANVGVLLARRLKPERALAIVRIAVGAIFLARTTAILRFARAPLLGCPDGKWHVALIALPAALVAALSVVRTVAAVSFTVGYRAREAGVVAAVAGWVALAQDPLAYVNTLELLFVSTFLVALADSSSNLALRRRPQRSMGSSLRLVRAIPISVYAFSAVAKLNPEFLSGRALLGFCADGEITGAIASAACASSDRAHALSLFVVACELSLPLALALPRTRFYALVAAIAFHTTLEVAMHPDVFGWIMLALLVAFIPGLRRGPDQSRTSRPPSRAR